jgi:hypothetical protein
VGVTASVLVSEPNSCLYISDERGIRGKEYSDTHCQFWYHRTKRFFAFCSREGEREFTMPPRRDRQSLDPEDREVQRRRGR